MSGVLKFRQNPIQTPPPDRTLSDLSFAQSQVIHLRDGEVVLFRREGSPLWQCRFKLQDSTWTRVSTRRASLEHAVTIACEMYDEARFRQRLGLAHKAQNFAQIAQATLDDLKKQIDLGRGKTAFHSYVSCIERYFLPYFSDKRLEEITHTDITEFELWRNRQMGRLPKTSTLNNFSSAWNKLIQTAINRGWISEHAAIPRLTASGEKGKTRPAFTRAEIDFLLEFADKWAEAGRLAVEKEQRPLLRDYVELLFYTGMRHGTEALRLQWNHIEWHTQAGKRYLRFWVDGKTGGRWLIAKHQAIGALKRLHQRQRDIHDIPFDELLTRALPKLLFRYSSGHQPARLDGTFKKLLRDCGLDKRQDGQMRTLYSIRHTYATLELLEQGTDIHTLARQMGNSTAIIERHYSKLTATMAADKLA
jgi:integrase